VGGVAGSQSIFSREGTDGPEQGSFGHPRMPLGSASSPE